jgi:hypothetical protein
MTFLPVVPMRSRLRSIRSMSPFILVFIVPVLLWRRFSARDFSSAADAVDSSGQGRVLGPGSGDVLQANVPSCDDRARDPFADDCAMFLLHPVRGGGGEGGISKYCFPSRLLRNNQRAVSL